MGIGTFAGTNPLIGSLASGTASATSADFPAGPTILITPAILPVVAGAGTGPIYDEGRR